MTSNQHNRRQPAPPARQPPPPWPLRRLLWTIRAALWLGSFQLLMLFITRHLAWFYALPLLIEFGYLGESALLGAKKLILDWRRIMAGDDDD